MSIRTCSKNPLEENHVPYLPLTRPSSYTAQCAPPTLLLRPYYADRDWQHRESQCVSWQQSFTKYWRECVRICHSRV